MFLASAASDNTQHGNSAEAKALRGGTDVPEAMKAQVELLSLALRRPPVAEVLGVGSEHKQEGDA
jgi:hypothetical protein